MTPATEQPIYDSDWAARQIEAYGALRRKEIAVKAVCWLIIAPALPVAIGYGIADHDMPGWCYWLGEKADTFAKRYDVYF